MTIWIVYQAVDRLIVGVFGTAADAAARVDAGTGLVATAGLTTAAALEAQPGQYYLTDGTLAFDLPLTDLDKLKRAARRAHAHLRHLWEELQVEGAAHPWAEMVKVHDYLARVHPSLYTLVKDDPLTRTIVQRTTLCDALLDGPQALGSALTIPVLFSTIAAADAVGTVQGVIYVNPFTDAHVSIATSLQAILRHSWKLGSSMEPLVVTEEQLASGDWADTITD